mgnify:CR=1 FL=1
MRLLTLVVAMSLLAGCASSPYPTTRDSAAFKLKNPHRHGYTDYDPCIRCGEGWIFLNIDDTAHLK